MRNPVLPGTTPSLKWSQPYVTENTEMWHTNSTESLDKHTEIEIQNKSIKNGVWEGTEDSERKPKNIEGKYNHHTQTDPEQAQVHPV
tara:strand:- start:40 stop:300 length:261 start_codon:yes stop_codon:yes gene_type:complete